MSIKKPNIVLMVADDHGLDTGTYGNTWIRTPNLDELATGGVRFTQAFCTSASCAASRSVILTGLYNHANGTYGHTHGAHHFSCFENTVTLPTLLNEAGYRTACIGKKHYAPKRIFPFQTDYGDDPCGRDDVKMAEMCRPFISEQDTKPFFLYWCSKNPHRDERRLETHPARPNRFGNPDEPFPGDEETLYRDEDVVVPPYLSDIPEVRAELAQYAQSVTRLDRGVGRLIRILKESGVYDNTVIIYVSDNGAAFPESKTTLYEPGMHLPCIVRSPFQEKRGTTCDGLITWADLTPTVVDFAGAQPKPDAFHGRSFRGILDSEHPTDWRNEAYASHTFHEITNYYPMRVIRTHKWKFIWNIAHPLTYSFAGDLWSSPTWQAVLSRKMDRLGSRSIDAYLHRPRFELYDLENDPNEVVNLADRPESAPLVADFTAKLKVWQKETRDPWIHKWTYE